MAAVMWIKMSSFLLLMLQIAETPGQNLFTFRAARAGHDITLSCENMIDQHNCYSTTWIFSHSSNPAVELVMLGQITAKNTSLNVTENCSLLIKKIKAEDGGRYICKQYRTREGAEEGPGHQVDLSVINMTEHEHNDKVIVTCSVLTREHCRYTVEWLHDGNINIRDMEIKPGSCSVTVTFQRFHRDQKSKFDHSLKCKVTDQYTKEEQLIPFKLKSSENTKSTTADVTSTTTKATKSPLESTTTSEGEDGTKTNSTIQSNKQSQDLPLLWLIVIPVGSAVLITAALITWKKVKGKEMQLDGNTGLSLNPAETQSGPGTNQSRVGADDGVSYVSISFPKRTRNNVRSRGRDEGDTVTYSTVKAFSSSAEADPNHLYSTINVLKN